MTNGDRIRSMSNEELAKIIAASDISEKIPFCKSLPECDALLESEVLAVIPKEFCQKCIVAWLEQEEQQ